MAADITHQEEQNMEALFRSMQPARLTTGLLTRLENAAEGTWTQVAATSIEVSLTTVSPAAMPADFLDSLVTSVGGLAFPQNGNIVPFPRDEQYKKSPRTSLFAAAAAVALAGASLAFLIPQKKQPSPVATTVTSSAISPGQIAPVSFERYDRGVDPARDEGILWQKNGRAHSVVGIHYNDKISATNSLGEELEIEKAGTKYSIVPQKVE